MKKSKLATYLLAFQQEEYKSFEQFVASPYFNTKAELVEFYKILRKQISIISEEKMDKKAIYNSLFPKKSYNEKHFGYLMSDLCKLIEQFFLIEKSQKEQTTKDAYFLDSLLERKLYNLFQQQFRKISNELEKEQTHNTAFYLRKYYVHDAAVRFYLSQQSRKFDKNHQIVTNSLDDFYFARKLRYSCSMLNNQNIVSTEFQINYLEEIQQHLDRNSKEDEPCIEVYHLASKMLSQEENETHFEKLKAFILQQIESLSTEDGRYIYNYAINYCARRVREGKRNYAEEGLSLYLHGIQNKVLYEDGFLSPWIYKNIITLSLRLRSYDWVEDFIHQYTPQLPPEFQDNALHFNLANLHYNRKDYDQSLYYLNQTQFTDISYNISSKMMLMQIYYELNEEDPLLSLIASFSLFLKRNKKISRPVKLTYLNFCTILNKIMRRNPKKLAGIREEVKTAQYLTARRWLMEVLKNWEEKL